MGTETRSEQATRILRALATMPGSTRVQVKSRRFARVGPAEQGNEYREFNESFRPNTLPLKRLFIPPDIEEVVFTMQGALPRRCSKEEVENQLQVVMGSICQNWDARTRFQRKGRAEGPYYEVTVFTDAHCV